MYADCPPNSTKELATPCMLGGSSVCISHSPQNYRHNRGSRWSHKSVGNEETQTADECDVFVRRKYTQ